MGLYVNYKCWSGLRPSYLIGCSHLASVLPLNARAGTVHVLLLNSCGHLIAAVTSISSQSLLSEVLPLSACKHFYRKYFYCKSLLAQVTSISTEAIYQLLDQDMSVTEVPAFLMFLESELSSLKSSQIQHDMFATFEDADTFLQKAIGRFLKVNVQHTSFRELVIRQGLTYKLADRRHARFPTTGLDVSKLQLDIPVTESLLKWATEILDRSIEVAKSVRLDDPGKICLQGWSPGQLSNPRFDWVKNKTKVLKNDELMVQHKNICAVFAVAWNLALRKYPKEIINDFEAFMALKNPPRIGTTSGPHLCTEYIKKQKVLVWCTEY
ncbi:hypothetical protein L211DRAFT_852400 [Terfezia boudieri ATCC MYA-4762]|uniref:Uncharacterized protein n=1 Tax=Terfezia boudieri ATCC MYA-4762 TaxID=1051890 RepID=A0A3N4LCF7_9PEZI|nr:hypothetical protein L211DRAFT_852400 [Terfezia boudieri ATCC MYA-4762]